MKSGLAAHLLRGVVDIGDRGLPTRSHGKMREVICSRSLRGSIQFPWRQGGRNTGSASKLSDRLTMGSVEVTSIDPVKLVRSKQLRHAVRGVASG